MTSIYVVCNSDGFSRDSSTFQLLFAWALTTVPELILGEKSSMPLYQKILKQEY